MPKRYIVAAAGSGKTTHLIREALKVENGRVLITTYTEENEREIQRKFIEVSGAIPGNVTVQTWFSLLLQHGVRPFQSHLSKADVRGMLLVNQRSGKKYVTRDGIPVYFKEDGELQKHYFTEDGKIYSDKISKFAFKCDEKSNNSVIKRLAKIYKHIFIDEVQDLAGYDLELIKLIFKTESEVLLVGDPRQVTYLTHHEAKNKKFSDGKIGDYLNENFKIVTDYIYDDMSLNVSHSNNLSICNFSSRLYPGFSPSKPCACAGCRLVNAHEGVFLVRRKNLDSYLKKFKPAQLKWNNASKIDPSYQSYNFGKAKGLSFDRVIIYPTQPMMKWLRDSKSELTPEARAKLYVAITRARHSVAFVDDFKDQEIIAGTTNYLSEKTE